MLNLRRSTAARLAVGYGLLVAASIAILAIVFYFGTIGLLDRNINGKIGTVSNRLIDAYQHRPREELAHEIDRLLKDGIDSDTEIYVLAAEDGTRLAGNLSAWPKSPSPSGQLVDAMVIRDGRKSSGRLAISPLPDGTTLVVGRDLQDRDAIQDMVWRSLIGGAAISLVLIVSGAFFFRRQIENRIGDIRRTARDIEAGDLTKRIPVGSEEDGSDEFGRLKTDINRMLDRIEHLVDGVRHVSNAIAHDLRTPLGRIRSGLDNAVRSDVTVATLSDAAHSAMGQIDDLILLFEKLLQIAEAESGMRPESFDWIDLQRIARDVVEFYNSSAEASHVLLTHTGDGDVMAMGDRNLIANAIASLIDNAIKYAGRGGHIEVGAFTNEKSVSVVVRDRGPGIPATELARVTERFYRLDQSRHLPGNGLGLSIASAIATLHRGKLTLENASPGLLARLSIPTGEAVAPSHASPQPERTS